MKDVHKYQSTLSTFLTAHQNLSSLSSQEVLRVFVSAYEAFMSSKISVDEFSGVCHQLWQRIEFFNRTSDDILPSEMANALLDASELSRYSRRGVENYPMFFQEVESFISSHKKIGKNKP